MKHSKLSKIGTEIVAAFRLHLKNSLLSFSFRKKTTFRSNRLCVLQLMLMLSVNGERKRKSVKI